MTNGASAIPGGKLEYAVLVALWERGQLSGRDVHRQIGAPLQLVYTTTAKVLDRLHTKGLVTRQRRGRVFVYAASAPRATVERVRAERTLVGLFGRQGRPALAALVDAVEAIDPALLDELAQAVEARRQCREAGTVGATAGRGGDQGGDAGGENDGS